MGARERWLVVQKDGRLRLHEENDGWTFLRNGAEASDWIISRESLRSTYPGLYEEMMRSDGKDTPNVFWER
jgi:hypothetical protein